MISHCGVHFANGYCAVEMKAPKLRVRAIRRAEHGDEKTQSVRAELMGMEDGEIGDLTEVWDNFYGRWCRVKVGAKSIDVRSSDLEVVK